MQVTRFGMVKPKLVAFGNAHLPEEFTVDITDEKFHGTVTLRLRVDKRTGPQITAISLASPRVTPSDLRSLRLPALVTAAVRAMTFRPLTDDTGQVTGGAFPSPAGSPAAAGTELRTRRYQTVNAAHLREVAAVYQAATHAPTKAVSDHFSTSRPTAARWVMAARASNYLPPVDRQNGATS